MKAKGETHWQSRTVWALGLSLVCVGQSACPDTQIEYVPISTQSACNTGTANCDKIAKCQDESNGGFECTCPPNTLDVHGDGTVCQSPQNGCVQSNHCDPHATCTATDQQGGYVCTCPKGYADVSHDGSLCVLPDPCAVGATKCDPLAKCVGAADGSYSCICPPGTVDVNKDGTHCEPPPPCESGAAKCDPSAKCTDSAGGSYFCTCPAGTVDVTGDGTLCAVSAACDQAIVIDPGSLPMHFLGDTSKGSDHASTTSGECPGAPPVGGAGANDVIYRFTPEVSGPYTFTVTTGAFAGLLYLATDCHHAGATCVGPMDLHCMISCIGSNTMTLDAGTTYSIFVEGDKGTSGLYTLDVARDPLQLDVKSLLTDDVVLNNGNLKTDPTQVPLDAENDILATASVVADLNYSGDHGLPDKGDFPGNANHPNVQLQMSNVDDGPNARVLAPGGSIELALQPSSYHRFFLWGTATDGGATMSFTLSYQDGTSEVRVTPFSDWTDPTLPVGQVELQSGLYTIRNGVLQVDNGKSIRGVDLAPDQKKKLKSVTATVQSGGRFTFFGATAD